MALDLRIKNALNKEYPITALAKFLPRSHKLTSGMALAHRFEKNFIDLPMSTVPPHRLRQYNQYLSRCRQFLIQKSSKQ